MSDERWEQTTLPVAALLLDSRNPRLGAGAATRTQRDHIRELFAEDRALELAESIARGGFFPNEPLLVVREGSDRVVVEGNRRLAALKALADPSLLTGGAARAVEKLRTTKTSDLPSEVPVVIAPNRRATDRLTAARHIGTPVVPWSTESRANFILDKLDSDYSASALQSELGFSAAAVDEARKLRAIANMARSLPLAEHVRERVQGRRSGVLTTLERIFATEEVREVLRIRPDHEHGFVTDADPTDFQHALVAIVTDVATGKETSRSLNTQDQIAAYVRRKVPDPLPLSVSHPIGVQPEVLAQPAGAQQVTTRKRQTQSTATVVPRSFVVSVDNDRLKEIRGELVKLKTKDFPNAGAMLLRAFVELAAIDYLTRSGSLDALVKRLIAKNKMSPKGGLPKMSDMVAEVIGLAKSSLPPNEASEVVKALSPNREAPFNVEDLNSFVHNANSFPGERDIVTFWNRVEPVMRLILSSGP